MKNGSLKGILIFAGAFCSMFIGTGFATGQECMQYFSNYGVAGSFLGLLLFLILSLWIDCSTLSYGYDSKRSPIRATYQFYGGKYIGRVFDILVPVFLLCCMVTMCAGAGSIFEEYWGWSHFVGVAIIVVIMFVSYLAGTKKLIEILGFIGPVIIFVSLAVCVYAAVRGTEFSNSTQLVEEYGGYRMGDHWWYASLQYIAFVPSVMVPFMGAMGRGATSKKEAVLGGAVGVVLVTLALALSNYAILSNYSAVCASNVPTVVFAGMLHPAIGTLFAIIVFLGLFTTAAPMLWTICSALPTNKNKTQDRIVAAIICILIIFAGQLPFAQIMNILYPVIAYAGLVWLVAAIIVQIRDRMGLLHDMDSEN